MPRSRIGPKPGPRTGGASGRTTPPSAATVAVSILARPASAGKPAAWRPPGPQPRLLAARTTTKIGGGNESEHELALGVWRTGAAVGGGPAVRRGTADSLPYPRRWGQGSGECRGGKRPGRADRGSGSRAREAAVG